MYDHPHLWIADPFAQLVMSEALHKIGHYEQSLIFGYILLFSELKPRLAARNHFTIAQNYSALKNSTKTRLYLDMSMKSAKQYYYFYYARFEEFEKNYQKSIDLYEKALTHPFPKKDYITKAYSRTLHSALLDYKNKDCVLFQEIFKKILLNPEIESTKANIIKKAIKL